MTRFYDLTLLDVIFSGHRLRQTQKPTRNGVTTAAQNNHGEVAESGLMHRS